MIFSALTTTDGHARIIPDLAESWKAIDATTWEFKLRPGVRFHNGSEFTAEDVAFTFDRVPNVPNSPSSYAIYTRPIREVQIVDSHTLRLKTAVPYPLMPTDLASIMILDKRNPCGGDDRGLQCRADGDRHRALPHGQPPQRRPHRVRAQRRLFRRAAGLAARQLPHDHQRRRAHRGAAGGRCGVHRPGADQRPGEAADRPAAGAVRDHRPPADLPRLRPRAGARPRPSSPTTTASRCRSTR